MILPFAPLLVINMLAVFSPPTTHNYAFTNANALITDIYQCPSQNIGALPMHHSPKCVRRFPPISAIRRTTSQSPDIQIAIMRCPYISDIQVNLIRNIASGKCSTFSGVFDQIYSQMILCLFNYEYQDL